MANYGPISFKLSSTDRPFIIKGAGLINNVHNNQGVVTSISVSLAIRIPKEGGITSSRTYTGLKFFLYKKNYPKEASFPSGWKNNNNLYYGSNTLTEANIPEENILAKNLNFSFGPTNKIASNYSANFEITDFGKDLSNWSGDIVLACTDYGREIDGRSPDIVQWAEGGTCSYTLTYLEQSVIPTSSLTPITLGTTSTINFTSYSSSYTHEITWLLGNKGHTTNVAAGKTFASYEIPTSWRDQFSTTESIKKGYISIKTKNANGEQIGSTNSYNVNYKVDNYDLSSSINLTCSKVTPSPSDRFSNDIFKNYLVKNYHKVLLAVTATADYNNTISKVSFIYGANSPVNGTGGTIAKDFIYNETSGSYSITDSRDKTKTIYFNKLTGISQTLITYTPCSYSSIEFYRATEKGEKDELGGSCVRVIIKDFKLSTTSPSIPEGLGTSIKIQVGKGGQTITPTASRTIDTTITDAYLSTDREYQLTITFSDISGLSTPFTGKILSSNYLLHFRKGQKSVGVGHAARNVTSSPYNNSNYSGLLSTKYTIELARSVNSSKSSFTEPLRVEDGGTGASNALGAINNLGLDSRYLRVNGTMTGPLKIGSNNYIEGSGGNAILSYNYSGMTGATNGTALGSRDEITTIRGSELKYFKYISENSTATYDILHGGNYNRFSPRLSELYYQKGDTVEFTDGLFHGFVTNSQNNIYLIIPLSKRLDKINSVTINEMRGHIRNTGGYAVQSKILEAGNSFTSYTITPTIITENSSGVSSSIKLLITGKTWILNNNESVTFVPVSFKITFQ